MTCYDSGLGQWTGKLAGSRVATWKTSTKVSWPNNRDTVITDKHKEANVQIAKISTASCSTTMHAAQYTNLKLYYTSTIRIVIRKLRIIL